MSESRAEQASRRKAVLIRARAILSDGSCWGKKAFRRMKFNNPDQSPAAKYEYCALGAIRQGANYWGTDTLVERDDGLGLSAESRAGQLFYLWKMTREGISHGAQHFAGIADWNDSGATHEGVLAFFDYCIKAESEFVQAEIARGAR